MKERPILFSGPMVRAIRENRKTQTRRVCRANGGQWKGRVPLDILPMNTPNEWVGLMERDPNHGQVFTCRYGQPGDRLWVRETWGIGTRPCPHHGWYDGIEYRADEAYLEDEHDILPCYKADEQYWEWLDERQTGKWKPSIHMPRWASRITLEVIGVRVERLQEISRSDCKSEGMGPLLAVPETTEIQWDYIYRHKFGQLWDSINGKKHPWESNPWVWVIEFQVC